MEPKELHFAFAYRFAQEAVEAITNPDLYDLADWFLEDLLDYKTPRFFDTISKPHKYTLLHRFIVNLNYFNMEHATGHTPAEMIVDEFGPLLEKSGFEVPEWFNEEELADHIHDLDRLLKRVSDDATEATFHILFGDRDFLYEFSKSIGPMISRILKSDAPKIMKADGVVKRAKYLPRWLKYAVFHRDRGRCQLCMTDLTGLSRPADDVHLDHILPLSHSGTNDPTNFQLLCKKCNSSKGGKLAVRKQKVFTFW